MNTWVLIVVLYSSGFSAEFVSKETCLAMAEKIKAVSLHGMVRLVECIEKGEKK